jgi:hypothetical protein
MRLITGIVGTAKNTGKTTTMSYLLRYSRGIGIISGVTGIGFDGEEVDNITRLPKPRLHFENNTIVTTSEGCLGNCTASYEVLKRTGIRTALGEVLILRITHPGILIVAGPNKRSSLLSVIEDMYELDAENILVDGSLNRLAPMAIADNIVFTTGAARSTDINFLVTEMGAIESIFADHEEVTGTIDSQTVTVATSQQTYALGISSLHDSEDLRPLKNLIGQNLRRIIVPDLISKAALSHLVKLLSGDGEGPMQIVLDSPLTLLMAGEPTEITSIVGNLARLRCTIAYRHKPSLSAITVNPFFPKGEGQIYSESYIDKDELYDRMRKNLRTPVYNIKEHDIALLYAGLTESSK